MGGQADIAGRGVSRRYQFFRGPNRNQTSRSEQIASKFDETAKSRNSHLFVIPA
jgi:hypothetical protein